MIPIAVLKYKDPADPSGQTWIPIGVPGVTEHSDLGGLDVGFDHPQYITKEGGPTGGTMMGDLFVLEPSTLSNPATKRYVDARAGAYVQPEDPGNPSVDPIPTGVRGALWVDTDDGVAGAEFLPITGGTIAGDLVVTGFFDASSVPSTINGHRRITISVDPPPAGVGTDGDIWFQRST